MGGTFVPPPYGIYTGQRKKGVDVNLSQYVIGGLGVTRLFSASSIGAGEASTTVVDSFPLPVRCKIPLIAVSCTSIVASSSAGNLFNIIVGGGAYETAGAQATGTYTLTGTPATGSNNVYTIAGTTVTAPQTTGNSLTVQAAADVVLINANLALARLVTASNVAGVITITANAVGITGNTIATTGASTGGDTETVNQATLSGGVAATGITTPQNDNSSQSGFCTNPAVVGNAMFAADVPLLPGSLYPSSSYGPCPFPGFSGTSGGSMVFVPASWDAVYGKGQVLTLRVLTPATTGAIANLVVTAVLDPQPLSASYPAQYPIDGSAAGVPVPNIDF